MQAFGSWFFSMEDTREDSKNPSRGKYSTTTAPQMKYAPNLQPMRRCQIEVQFESGAKIKFLESSFQSVISISNYQSVPWTHSFQKMYNTYMGKIHLKVEKWGLTKKIYLNFMKNCKVLLQCFTLGHFISTIMNTNHKVSYINENVLTWGTTL